MLFRTVILVLTFWSFQPAFAQGAFSADFPLPDGVYLSHASLLATQPDLEWDAIDGEMVQLPEDFRIQIEDYGYKDERLEAGLLPYAISLDGQPYFFTWRDENRGFYEFTGLRVAGTLSVMTYDTTYQVRHLITAYNPANGRPFREAYVERKKTETLDRVLHLPTGSRFPLDRPNVLLLVADDPELTKAVRDLPEATPELLLRAVKLYDDRYPTTLPLE